MKCVLLLLLLPLLASAKDVYQVHTLSEKQILQTYTAVLHDACIYSGDYWKTSSFDPAAGYWGQGVSTERGIRMVGHMLVACGSLLKYDEQLTDAERKDLLAKSIAALRYITATHFTGTQKCTDGKPWGGLDRPGSKNWQTCYWTGSCAMGAWLIWDKLDAGLKTDIERVVAAQNDLLTKGNPPVNLLLDTKAEENGWSVPCLALGELMFPGNPHAQLWHETTVKYMMNTLCTEADTHDTNIVDGRRVNEWVLGANLQPDYTLENHNIFHPSYVGCSSYFLTEAAMCYAYAGKPAPQAAMHHLMDTWSMFRTIILPWGEAADPQGMDWELHGLPFMDLYGTLATRDKDAFAARMEQSSLQYMRGFQVMCHGSLTLPGSPYGFTRTAVNAELVAFGFLGHKIFGPATRPLTARQANVQEEGVWDRPYVDFIEQRTLKKFASFSWKNKIMGVIMPVENHEDNPLFTVPISDGLVGSFEVAGRGNKMTVVEHSRKKSATGFETEGTVLINDGSLKQTIKVTSIGAQTVVYEDRVIALTNVTIKSERGLPIGIENDSLTGGTWVVSDANGEVTFDWQKPKKPTALPGAWANVDGRLGVVVMQGSGMDYNQASKYSSLAVYTDLFYGSYSTRLRQFKTGDEVAHRLGIFSLETSPKETAKLAKSCQMVYGDGPGMTNKPWLRFKQPDGKVAVIPML